MIWGKLSALPLTMQVALVPIFDLTSALRRGISQYTSMTPTPSQSPISPPPCGHVAPSKDRVYPECLIGPSSDHVARDPDVTRMTRSIHMGGLLLTGSCLCAAPDNGCSCREAARIVKAIGGGTSSPRLVHCACNILAIERGSEENVITLVYGHR